MFIYSIRLSTIRFFAIILLGLVMVTGLVIGTSGESVSAISTATEINYGGIKTKEDRLAFMENFGVKVDPDSEESAAFRMPPDFDRVILGYNELQKKQGLDLSKYKNKRVTRYTYRVVGDEDCYANLFIYRGKIVACDISSASPDGFVLPLTMAQK
jgi:hypothetical protein